MAKGSKKAKSSAKSSKKASKSSKPAKKSAKPVKKSVAKKPAKPAPKKASKPAVKAKAKPAKKLMKAVKAAVKVVIKKVQMVKAKKETSNNSKPIPRIESKTIVKSIASHGLHGKKGKDTILKTRYSDKELEEFRQLILDKLEAAKNELKYLQ